MIHRNKKWKKYEWMYNKYWRDILSYDPCTLSNLLDSDEWIIMFDYNNYLCVQEQLIAEQRGYLK